MQRRSTTIFLIGLLTLVLGMAVTYAALHHPPKAAAEVNSHGAAGAAAPDPNAVTIPEGKQALAVSLDPVAGTAGVAHVGSHIDVFAATAKDDAPNGINAARMIMQNVEVLRVDQGGVASISPKDVSRTPVNGSSVFVLAVNQTQAEKLVYHASFSKLWFSVVPDGQKPVGPTPGVDLHNQLNPEAA